MKIPGPDHPISVTKNPARIVVRLGDRVIGETREAMTLREASYPPVLYLPRDALDMSCLERTTHMTHCPYKGDASYFSLPEAGADGTNMIWTYETPYEAVATIKDHLAFYAGRGVTLIEEDD